VDLNGIGGVTYQLGVHYLSTTYQGQYEGYGDSHVLTADGSYLTDVSLVFIPSWDLLTWRTFFYAQMPNCSTGYDFYFSVVCIAHHVS